MKSYKKCLALAALVLLHAASLSGQPQVRKSQTKVSVMAHMRDGTVAVFPSGLILESQGERSTVSGLCLHPYEKDNRPSPKLLSFPLTEVSALEYFELRHGGSVSSDAAISVRASEYTSAYSSPVIYTFDGENFVLEAETFSTSLLPSIEADDMDRLTSGVTLDGEYRLQLRNQALETHYVNSLHLLAVDHPEGYLALPTRKRKILVVGHPVPAWRVVSRDGRDATALVASEDGLSYRTSPAIADKLTSEITEDWIEFEVDVPPGKQRVYVTARARNTLFQNLVAEDAVLAGKGVQALDLLAGERFRPLEMLRLYRWCKKTLGLRLEVETNGAFKKVDRIGGTGPAAWREVVMEVRIDRPGPVRLRLSFLADTWIIDRVGISFERTDEFSIAEISAHRVEAAGASVSADNVSDRDKDYLMVYPGEIYEVVYMVGPPTPGLRRTYLLRSRGYFVKWLPPDVIDTSRASVGLGRDLVTRAARRWLLRKDDIEAAVASRLSPPVF